MIRRARIYISKSFDPHRNLALEEYFLRHLEPETAVFYLWQNDRTIVIGKNQNPFQECRTGKMEQDGVFLARRKTGGGAVYHDKQNLCFTFVVPREDYDYQRQASVILDTLQSYGLQGEITGRNDMVVDGRKFSGNAFTFKEEVACHHGTLLIQTDMSCMADYLQVSLEKLQSKGVKSVRSRVINLHELNPDITVEGIKPRLVDSFQKVYNVPCTAGSVEELNQEELEQLYQEYSSPEFLFGATPAFNVELQGRATLYQIHIHADVVKGKVQQCKVYSDALDTEFVEGVEKALLGADFHSEALCQALKAYFGEEKQSLTDALCTFLMEKNF
ncbi:MAG: lipoate--protein ligase [Eubacteriales bacterium]|jgi:lipoate-protein ligase A